VASHREDVVIRRIFILHQRQIAQDVLDEYVEKLHAVFSGFKLRDGSPVEPVITTGRVSAKEWEKAHPGLAFNWESWIGGVTGMVSTFSKEPRFHYFVVGPGPYVGRATGQILDRLIRAKRQVFYYDGMHLSVASDILKISASWKDGLMVVAGAPVVSAAPKEQT
jgi:hypothetical protein